MNLETQEVPSEVIWNFFELAYRTGLVDKALELVGDLANPNTDLLEQLAAIERLAEEIDFESADNKFRTIIPIIKKVSNEETMEGLKIFLDIMAPYLNRALKDANGDFKVLVEKGKAIVKTITLLKPAAFAIAPVVIDNIIAVNPSWKTRFILKRIKKRAIKKGGGK